MKKYLFALLMLTWAILSLSSCGSFSGLSNEDAYRNGYNMGVFLRGGDESEYLRR